MLSPSSARVCARIPADRHCILPWRHSSNKLGVLWPNVQRRVPAQLHHLAATINITDNYKVVSTLQLQTGQPHKFVSSKIKCWALVLVVSNKPFLVDTAWVAIPWNIYWNVFVNTLWHTLIRSGGNGVIDAYTNNDNSSEWSLTAKIGNTGLVWHWI